MAKRESKNYFTQETEDMIILYNKTTDSLVRSRIYEAHIHYAFFKLTQNIIHTFKFYHTDVEELEDLQHEIIVFLLSKIHQYGHAPNIQKRINKIIVKEFGGEYNDDFVRYVNGVDRVSKEQINAFISSLHISDDPTIKEECLNKLKTITPPKAYSYFGTIVKRWLITYNAKIYDSKINNSQVEDLYHDPNHSYHLEDTPPNIDNLSKFINSYIDFTTNNIYTIFPKNENAKVADAILEIFRKRKDLEDIEDFNKKLSYIYIREILPGVKTTKITNIIKILKTLFYKNYIFFLENGYIDFEEVHQ